MAKIPSEGSRTIKLPFGSAFVPPTVRQLTHWLPIFWAVGLCLFCLVRALNVVGEIEIPSNIDQYRDAGMGQSILEGKYPADPMYLGETIWYNPLIGIILAAWSGLTGETPLAAIVTLGPYINLIIPALFFAMVWVLSGRWVAIAALTYFLFKGTEFSSAWAQASYTPHLYEPVLTQALFYLTLLFFYSWITAWHRKWAIATGVALGLTFVGHAFPAVLAGGIISVTCAVSYLRIRGQKALVRELVRGFLVLIVIAFLISLPFSYSILWNYQFRMVDTKAALWTWWYLSLDNLPNLIHDLIGLTLAMSLLGFIYLFHSGENPARRSILVSWTVVVLGFLFWSFIDQAISPGYGQNHGFVPNYHYYLYFSALRAVLFGIGVVFLADMIQSLSGWLLTRLNKDSMVKFQSNAFVGVIIILCTGFWIPEFGERLDYRVEYQPKYKLEFYEWLITNTNPNDVFGALSDEDALELMLAAGRKIIAPSSNMYFSNPYVDGPKRAKDLEAMRAALHTFDLNEYRQLAQRYQVTYILACDEKSNATMQELRESDSKIELQYRNSFCSIFESP